MKDILLHTIILFPTLFTLDAIFKKPNFKYIKEIMLDFKPISVFIATLLGLIPVNYLGIIALFLYSKQLITTGAFFSFILSNTGNFLLIMNRNFNHEQLFLALFLKTIISIAIGIYLDYRDKVYELNNPINHNKTTDFNFKNIMLVFISLYLLEPLWQDIAIYFNQYLLMDNKLIQMISTTIISILPSYQGIYQISEAFLNNIIGLPYIITSLLINSSTILCLSIFTIKDKRVWINYFVSIIIVCLCFVLFI